MPTRSHPASLRAARGAVLPMLLALSLADATSAVAQPASTPHDQHQAHQPTAGERREQGGAAAQGHQHGATHNPSGAHADHFGRHFDDAAEWAKTFDDPARDAWQLPDRVIDALRLARGQVVADLGAGTGYFSTRLAKSAAAPRVLAVDVEPSMVAYLTERARREGLDNLSAVQAGADRANLPEPVDLVLVVDTYHHIPARIAYFSALKASLKPGGRVAIIDFRKDAPQGPPVEFRFSPEQITDELTRAGFTLERTHEFLPQQVFLVYRAQ